MKIEITDKPFDVYIGTGAGSQLLSDIRGAEHRIRIMSPYISPREMQLLSDQAGNGCKVDCIATIDLQQFDWRQSETARNVIAQERTPRPALLTVFRGLLGLAAALTVAAVAGLVLLFARLELLLGIELLQPLWVSFPVVIGGAIAAYGIARLIPVHRYRYSNRFPVKFLVKNGGGTDATPFHHVKLYLIDERISYLGSLNFTDAGLQTNVESCMRSTDEELAAELSRYFDRVLETYPEAEVQWLGKRVYREAKNPLRKGAT